MGGADVPNLTSLIALAFAGAVAALVTFFERRRAKAKPETGGETEARVLAGSVVDGRSVREVADGLRGVRQTIEHFMEQQHDDSRAQRTVMEDMIAAVKRNTEAQAQGAVTPRELAQLIGRMKGPSE